MSELEERGHCWFLPSRFAHTCGDAPLERKGERGRRKGKGKGKGRGVPWTLPSRSPKGPASALLKARARQEAEMEVWGRPSSPLLSWSRTPPCCGGLRSRGEALRAGGGSPGTAACPREKRPQPGCASYLGSLFFRETRSPSPLRGIPKSWALAACPKECQALAAAPLHPLPRSGWLGSSRRWG